MARASVVRASLALFVLSQSLSFAPAQTPPLSNGLFDLVIARGRVIDPASGEDSIRDLAIKNGKIAALGAPGTLHGKEMVDASSLVVTAGFIDLHQHGQTPENYRLKALDGVTTALEMEVGVSPVAKWYESRKGRALINYGAAVGHIPIRMAVMGDSGTFLPRDKAVDSIATPEQEQEIARLLREGLQQGALGIGVGLAYVPGAQPTEVLKIFSESASAHVPVYAHLRSAGPIKPGGLDALQEVVTFASATGSSLHVVHITSTMLRQTHLALQFIEGAHRNHLDFTTEAYPYTAGMTEIQSAIFSPGWEGRNGGITYHDLQWAKTGERLTAETFKTFRQQGGMVAIHSIPPEVVKEAMQDPDVIIASDGILENGKGHPRAAGTYARVLARFVREQHTLTLAQALRKMSYLPALRLGVASKGRIQVGADADITVFSPEEVTDMATYENPATPSKGTRYVIVNGTPVVRDGAIVTGIYPGLGIRRHSTYPQSQP